MAARNDNRYDPRRGPRDRSLRVGDGEREAVAEILRQQHAEGRLDSEEFQERIDRCLAAKTYADLDALVADLPGPESAQGPAGRRWNGSRLPFVVPAAVLVAAIALTGGHLFWLAVPFVFFFVVRPLLWRSVGPGYYGRACRPPYGPSRRAP